MIKPDSPEQLAEDILKRSICAIQVGAAIVDLSGRIISWGWNSMGSSGFGECAEKAAIRRANKDRLVGATVYVAGQYKRNGNPVNAMPCPSCEKLMFKHRMAAPNFRGKDRVWVDMEDWV